MSTELRNEPPLPSTPAAPTLDTRMALGQFPTPGWAAEALYERHFSHLGRGDVVWEPTCGPGYFLAVVPPDVDAFGSELDPALARAAAVATGRLVLQGDFETVALPATPTVVIGNPPFQLDLIDRLLQRVHSVLPSGGQAAFLLPAYAFQTAARVAGYAEDWSIAQEMIPRNIYPGLKLPLVFATFTKDGRRRLFGVVSENGQQSTVSKPALPLSCSHIATTIEPLKPSREMTMSTADTYVRARIDTSTKERAADALEAMGLSISDAIRLLMLRIADERRMPFDVKAPNATTRKAIAELEAGKGKRFASVDDLMADLHADD